MATVARNLETLKNAISKSKDAALQQREMSNEANLQLRPSRHSSPAIEP
jgi:hypothetical protein